MSNQPKMTRREAITLWNTLTPEQKTQFNKMLAKMQKGELMLQNVNVDKNEVIQNIVLEPKDKKGKSDKPFYKHFDIKPIDRIVKTG